MIFWTFPELFAMLKPHKALDEQPTEELQSRIRRPTLYPIELRVLSVNFLSLPTFQKRFPFEYFRIWEDSDADLGTQNDWIHGIHTGP